MNLPDRLYSERDEARLATERWSYSPQLPRCFYNLRVYCESVTMVKPQYAANRELFQSITADPRCKVSNFGRVLGVKKQELRGWLSCGYRTCWIAGGNALVHRLVLEVFVGPCPEGMEGCHNDGDRLNNNLRNLRWGTRSENMLDAAKHGTHPGFLNRGKPCLNSGEKCNFAKLAEVEVRAIRAEAATKRFTQNYLAIKYRVSAMTISDIVNWTSWKHLRD